MAYNPIAKNLSNVTTAATIEVPAGVMVQDVVIKSNNANAVLGGVKIGTTAEGTDVLASVAVWYYHEPAKKEKNIWDPWGIWKEIK